MTLLMFNYKELHKRTLRLLDLADWDYVILDRLEVGWLRVKLLNNAVSIESINHASIIYRADMRGNITNWNASLIPAALETMRRHMVLDDLAEVSE